MSELAYPAAFHIADEQSKADQKSYVRFVRIDLIAIVIAAILGATASLFSRPASSYIYGLSIACLLVALSVEFLVERRSPEDSWYDGRAVAESIKTSSWRYAMRAEPYDGDDAEAASSLLAVIREAVAARPDLVEEEASPASVVTSDMQSVRTLPLGPRRDRYLAERVRDQQAWYARKADDNERQARLWFQLGFCARIAALAVAVVAFIRPFGSGFVEFFVALAAALTAWNQLRRHTELARAYDMTAQELAAIAANVSQIVDELSLCNWVLNTESAISREHTMWMAKRVKDPRELPRSHVTTTERTADQPGQSTRHT